MATPQHLQLPMRLSPDGSLATLGQDTIDDVTQCIQVVIETPIGARTELPSFGTPRLEFSQPVPLAAVLTAIYTWEPRAAVLVRRAITGNDDLESDITLEVSV